MINYVRFRRLVMQIVKGFGMKKAVLRHKTKGDRFCWCVVTDYNSVERASLTNPVNRMAVIAALAPDGKSAIAAPDRENEVLVTFDPITGAEFETLRMAKPPAPLAPSGLVLYWELEVAK